MPELWYDYIKQKYVENTKLCYTRWYLRFDTSKFEIERPIPKGENKKVVGSMKDELGEQIMKKFVGLRAKKYSYLKDNSDEDKKAKDTKNCFIKWKLKFQDYKNCLEAGHTENNINHLEKNKTDFDSLKAFVKNNKVISKTQQRSKCEKN